MKKIVGITLMALAGAVVFSLSSCYKKFDPKSYQPAFTVNGYSSVTEIASGNLVGYWALDGSYIDSVSKAVATNAGTSFATGFKGQGASFDVAAKSYITTATPTAIKNMSSFTISFWANPKFVDADNDTKIDGIIGFVNLARTDDFWGDIDWFIENGSTASLAIIKVHVVGGSKDTWLTINNVNNLFGKWANHSLTYDAGTNTLTYYVNGSSVGSATASWTGGIQFPSPGPLVFGTTQFQTTPSLGTAGGSQSWASYLTGMMDEIRIYNKALSASELQAMVALQGKGK
ncbi:MAG: LamG-like jellyroll fold domain-containing protein [Flavisolibacter sp.]